MVWVGSGGLCLVTVAANSDLWRSHVRRSASCRAVGTLEELPHWNRDWRIRLKLTGFVYRAHNPRSAQLSRRSSVFSYRAHDVWQVASVIADIGAFSTGLMWSSARA